MVASHLLIEHTADLALELRAGSEAELLAEGARALVELLTEGARVEADGRRRLDVQALDGPDRLVQWLNEILLLATVDGFLARGSEIELNGAGLSALLLGRERGWDLLRREVKAVTWHDLVLEQRDGAWFARIVIDV